MKRRNSQDFPSSSLLPEANVFSLGSCLWKEVIGSGLRFFAEMEANTCIFSFKTFDGIK